MPFTVRLNQPAGETTTVHYATADGTATAATDYNATSGDLTFIPGGSQVQTVNVTLKNDNIYEQHRDVRPEPQRGHERAHRHADGHRPHP